MLHLRKPLQTHQIRDSNGAEFANAAKVITKEVGDHHQLGAFLFTGLQLVGKLGVVFRIGTARPGALDGASLDVLPAQAQETFRAGGGNLEIAGIKEGCEWRWTGCLQRTMEFPAIAGPWRGEALGEVYLIDVAGADVRKYAARGGDE